MTKSADSKINVLHAYKSYYPDVYGGIPYVISQFMRIKIDIFNHILLVCSANKIEGISEDSSLFRVKSYGNLFSLPISPSYPIHLYNKMKQADIVVVHYPFPLADLVIGLGLQKKTPVIVYWHADIVSQKLLGALVRPLLRRTLKRAKKIIISHESNVTTDSLLLEFQDKIEIVTYPIDTIKVTPRPEDVEKIANIVSVFPNLILSCGRLVSYKGYEYLISALAKLEVFAIIIGDGVEKKKLLSQIDSLKIGHRVMLLGSVDDDVLRLYLNAAKIFIFPSISNAETFGIAQIEAMAAGCAIINTQLDTASTFVARHQREAITVKPKNSEQLASAIEFLLRDTKERDRLAKNAKNRALHLFSFQKFEVNLSKLLINSMQ
jgi:glycosyltransferase involved in cell wall biosynthesis